MNVPACLDENTTRLCRPLSIHQSEFGRYLEQRFEQKHEHGATAEHVVADMAHPAADGDDPSEIVGVWTRTRLLHHFAANGGGNVAASPVHAGPAVHQGWRRSRLNVQ